MKCKRLVDTTMKIIIIITGTISYRYDFASE